MGIVTIDPQTSGWRDDGHESGVVRVERVNADFARIPIREANYYAELQGTAAATYQAGLFTANPDGTPRALTLGVPAGLNNGVRAWFPFQGRGFGVRWQSVSATPDFTVVVDGEPVGVVGWQRRWDYQGITTQLYDSLATAITHDHLDPQVPHVAEIIVVSDPSLTMTVNLFGWLLDRAAGYTEPPRMQLFLAPIAVPATNTAITLTSGSSSMPNARGVRGIIYRNTTAGALDITVYNNGVEVWGGTIPAKGSLTWDLLAPTYLPVSGTALYSHMASGAGLTYSPLLVW